MINESVHQSHRAHISNDVINVKSTSELIIGDVIQFLYKNEARTVYVLNPEFEKHLHGLTLKKIDRKLLIAEVDEKRRPRDTTRSFYDRVIDTPKIIKTDSYRTYDVSLMSNIQRVPYDF